MSVAEDVGVVVGETVGVQVGLGEGVMEIVGVGVEDGRGVDVGLFCTDGVAVAVYASSARAEGFFV